MPSDPIIEALPVFRQTLRAAKMVAQQIGLKSRRLPNLTAGHMRRSIEKSLMALKVDVIDILFLHDPSLERMPEAAELLAEADRQKARGTIRFIGLAGDYSAVLAIANRYGKLADIVQVPEDQWNPEVYVPDLTFSCMRRGAQSRLELPLDPRLAIDRMKRALGRRPNGSVVVSSTRREHLQELVSAAAELVPA